MRKRRGNKEKGGSPSNDQGDSGLAVASRHFTLRTEGERK